MKIVVLKGSPRYKGNSNSLVDEFIRGAKGAILGTKFMNLAYRYGKELKN